MNPLHLIGKLIPDNSDIGDIARHLFSIVIVSLVISALILLAIVGGAMWGEYQTRRGSSLVVPQVSTARVEYYRGVFDVCLANDIPKARCVMLVQYAINNDWYETESDGWNESEYDLK